MAARPSPSVGSGPLEFEAANDDLRDQVRHEPDHEQDRREVEERRDLAASSTAPWNWLAIRLASVSPARRATRGSSGAGPITCVTAIASPSARPSPRISAAAIPGRDDGRTTPRTISHGVAPSASAPSSSSRGTARNSSRQMLGDDRDDHDRQDQAGDEDRRSTAGRPEDRDEARACRAATARRGRDERSEHEDPPQAEHHAWDGGEHLDERHDDPLHPGRRELAEEQPDRDPDRAGDHQGHRLGTAVP